MRGPAARVLSAIMPYSLPQRCRIALDDEELAVWCFVEQIKRFNETVRHPSG